jgi:hypothetical protein
MFLHEAVARQPLIDLRWQSEFTAARPREDGVALQIRGPKGDHAFDACHVLAVAPLPRCPAALGRAVALRVEPLSNAHRLAPAGPPSPMQFGLLWPQCRGHLSCGNFVCDLQTQPTQVTHLLV